MATLKVYRTPIGFHDAYVAAPSQKAALAAWGSDHNLFARGVAEIVTDPDLTQEPLARPGTVIKRSRGTIAEQIAALPPDTPRKQEKTTSPSPASDKSAPRKKPKPKPRPDRRALDAAETAIAEAVRRHGDARQQIDARIAALQQERADLLRTQQAETAAGKAARDDAAAEYDEAMRAWRG